MSQTETKKIETKAKDLEIKETLKNNNAMTPEAIAEKCECTKEDVIRVAKELEAELNKDRTPITGWEAISKTPIYRKKKVSIVGFAPSTMRDVQYVWDDPEMEVWSLNQLYMAFPEIVEHTTRWWQIHHRHSYDQTTKRDHSHHEWMSKQTNFPIYMQKKEADVPLSIPFPKKMMLEHFRHYFTNSISWEIALAIYEGFEEIHLYGVDMAQDSEYAFERPSVEYFIGLAEGRGIKFVLPEKCDLLYSEYLYPFEDTGRFRIKMEARHAQLRQQMQTMSQQEQAAHDQRLVTAGAIENMNYIKKTWFNSLEDYKFEGMS